MCLVSHVIEASPWFVKPSSHVTISGVPDGTGSTMSIAMFVQEAGSSVQSAKFYAVSVQTKFYLPLNYDINE